MIRCHYCGTLYTEEYYYSWHVPCEESSMRSLGTQALHSVTSATYQCPQKEFLAGIYAESVCYCYSLKR